MILVDTNIIIDFWDKPTIEVEKIFAENDWLNLAKLFIVLKKKGLVVPFQDGVIAYLAIKNNCEVWTDDKHFKLMQSALPDLKLYTAAV